MRVIPYYGCMSASGISIGLDSSIVLAHHYFPIQIVRYYPEYDDYIYDQSLDEIEEPILSISTFYEGSKKKCILIFPSSSLTFLKLCSVKS